MRCLVQASEEQQQQGTLPNHWLHHMEGLPKGKQRDLRKCAARLERMPKNELASRGMHAWPSGCLACQRMPGERMQGAWQEPALIAAPVSFSGGV